MSTIARASHRLGLAALLLAGLASTPALAQPVQTDHLLSQLVAESSVAVRGQPLRLGLLLEHDPHWHTYWINPGDSGLPTTLELTLPDGVKAGPIEWPMPGRYDLAGIINYGYGDRTLLPLTLQIPDDYAGSSLTIDAAGSWLICEVECIPGKGEYRLTLPVADNAGVVGLDPRWRDDFARADAAQPREVDGLAAEVALDGEQVRLEFTGTSPQSTLDGAPDSWRIFPRTPDVISNSAPPQWQVEGGQTVVRWPKNDYFSAMPQTVAFVLSDGSTHVALDASVMPAAAGTTATAGSGNAAAPPPVDGGGATAGTGLLLALGLAVLGGLVLNLMPCVFPVLSIKAMGALDSAHDRAALRAHGLWYAAGVVLSFVALAAVLLALRAGGEQLGWGFQLQQPGFVAALALLLFAMALGFSGVWEFGAGLGGVGQRLTEGHGARAAFFTGVLAAVVASPCTAPFMGTALGYALTQPAIAALAVFAALGIGLALPMLLLGFVPAIARLLPRPGRWMEGFRQLLAFPLYLTVIWLLWVYGEQTSALGMAWLLAALTALAFALWLLERRRRMQARGLRLVSATAALAALLFALGSPIAAAPAPDARVAASEAGIEPWSESRLDELRAAGQPVLVNMTAAWCITCLANERVALSSDSVRQALDEHGVTYLKGDWTRRDEAITRYLEKYQRNGVPLYVLYPADGGAPVVLPQLLTPDIVVDAIRSL